MRERFRIGVREREIKVKHAIAPSKLLETVETDGDKVRVTNKNRERGAQRDREGGGKK